MDLSPCSLDREFSDQIAALLSPPSLESAQEYHDEIIKRRQCRGIQIKQGEFGKGVYANVDFKEDELILKDQMLVASQHSSNKIDCLVCSYCFCFIGSVELQIGRKLYLQGLGLSAKEECDIETISDDSEEDFLVETTSQGYTRNGDCVKPCASSSMNGKTIPEEILASLMNNSLVLPYSERFSLPPVVSCPGGCEEEHYCSKLCAEADWEAFHSLLCTGEKSDSPRREAVVKFIEHASRTNDIFILAAKVISSTILKYKKLKAARFGREVPVNNGTNISCFTLLLEAWKPVSMGFKNRWWDCVALPNDVDSNNEVSFRMQIRDLAYTSLQLLREAIFDEEYAPCILEG
ncbi:hypothetical protein Taro_016972 [Colocasia esculenta]|uniref:MYND-type domain-containing protein n=1 Tax=Colocasia esculenta TaxID=4460 RepID=A0A843UXX3_COLES|nr:hypothetical protein [Colocasia esculenta]